MSENLCYLIYFDKDGFKDVLRVHNLDDLHKDLKALEDDGCTILCVCEE